MAKKKKNKPKVSKQPRDKRVAFMVTPEELNALNKYLGKYKINNRSRWFRETLLAHILKVYDDDYPTLFGENEMRR
ncbi:hypothetical protein LJB98_03230 [Bacteroidales bacterium OttesenSCG-928-M11]|nr:hypothetical protein [Bacteroidales bacterium OttesenSCG-928-M11]